ncbi:TIGR02646 family protein [Acinetobacter sp. CIP 64.2]|uniref:retron system putative HNH endonuclease n=1 Tax=Acinetobacter TaxID=469 RepID=UPI000289E90C|nr:MULTISPECIES: retron system putative HNH endonuclease [Acinetobacter]OJU84514.1 MAG: TIGR02646 family protein [Acinetobacter sp. 39-4]OJU92494.1 MAG: TIGR02646 family protein [Acinetobacter sp. 38-8]ENX12333.1 TIGR02646 family protein [Acinetobacter sp. CIP 64.2]NAS03923.1 TIGR02646 family protein [Acinetobacter haemolyticus]QHI31989.1 TIGR02646 family protein [Acinetobacter haemolyticus]
MKKINKSLPPNPLTVFYSVSEHKHLDWEDFRLHLKAKSYDQLKEIIFQDQGFLCGYCEDSVINIDKSKTQIEHFHDKSDKDLTITNWALDWNNVFGVCNAGVDEKEAHALPRNLSCDGHKNHIKNKSKKSASMEGEYLNPLEIPYDLLFTFDKATGFLNPNLDICQTLHSYTPNNYRSFAELVQNTIDILNLNCDRLAQKRLTVLHEYNRLLKNARINKNPQLLEQLPQQWFQKKWPSFFTVRRCLLGVRAEKYLKENGYGL